MIYSQAYYNIGISLISLFIYRLKFGRNVGIRKKSENIIDIVIHLQAFYNKGISLIFFLIFLSW